MAGDYQTATRLQISLDEKRPIALGLDAARGVPPMSAFGGKADIIQGVVKCPLIAKSGHTNAG